MNSMTHNDGTAVQTHDHLASAAPPVGRFAPTPSGRMHLGNAFSCLMAWLAARSAGGRIVVRIEDLDTRAQHGDAARLLMEDLRWLGLEWDEGPIFQHERTERYRIAVTHLAAHGLVYPCFCTRAELHAASAPHASDGTYLYPGTCRNLSPHEIAIRAAHRTPALRVAVPAVANSKGTIAFEDLTYGFRQEQLATTCGDFLVRRSDGVYAYQLAVVVDDHEMGITQVVRGRDLLGSVARQSWLAQQLGWQPPTYGHIPLLVAPDGRRLSKRDHDLDLGVLRERSTSPNALIGALAHAVGLAGHRERVSAEQLIGRFGWEALREHRDDIVVDNTFLP